MQKRGKFIVFEGIDGCGKSTQLWKLAKHISDLSKYNHLLLTREPYQKKEIREILKQDESPEEQAEKLAELFVEDRKQHINDLILPALEKGKWILSDRYKHSTISYQAAQGLSHEKLIQMHQGLQIPDATFIIDLPTEVAKKRMQTDEIRSAEQKFEKSTEFQEKVRQNYLKSKQLHPNENIFIINGDRTVEEIFNQVREIFDELFSDN